MRIIRGSCNTAWWSWIPSMIKRAILSKNVLQCLTQTGTDQRPPRRPISRILRSRASVRATGDSSRARRLTRELLPYGTRVTPRIEDPKPTTCKRLRENHDNVKPRRGETVEASGVDGRGVTQRREECDHRGGV